MASTPASMMATATATAATAALMSPSVTANATAAASGTGKLHITLANEITMLAMAGINAIFTITTTTLFLARRQHPVIRHTAPYLAALQSLSHLIFSTTELVTLSFPNSFPGFLMFWVTNLCVVLWIMCVLGRAVRLVVLYRWNEGRLEVSEGVRKAWVEGLERERYQGGRGKRKGGKGVLTGGSFDKREVSLASTSTGPRSPMSASTAPTTASSRSFPSPGGSTLSFPSPGGSTRSFPYPSPGGPDPVANLDVDALLASAADNEVGLGANPEKAVGRRVALVIAAAMLIQIGGCVALQLMLPDPVSIMPMAMGEASKSIFKTHLLSAYVVAGLYLAMGSPVLLYMLRNVRDANGIRTDITTTLIVGMPLFVTWLVMLSLPATSRTINQVLPSTYIPVIVFLTAQFTSIVVPLWRTRKGAMIKRARDSVHRVRPHPQPQQPSKRASRLASPTSNSSRSKRRRRGDDPEWGHVPPPLSPTEQDFRHVLTTPQLFHSLKRFCATDFTLPSALLHESLTFYRGVIDVMSDQGLLPRTGLIADGGVGARNVIGQIRYIYETFVREGAMSEVEGLSKGVRRRVERDIEEGRWSVEVFDEVERENEGILFGDVFPKIIILPLYSKFTHYRAGPGCNNGNPFFSVRDDVVRDVRILMSQPHSMTRAPLIPRVLPPPPPPDTLSPPHDLQSSLPIWPPPPGMLSLMPDMPPPPASCPPASTAPRHAVAPVPSTTAVTAVAPASYAAAAAVAHVPYSAAAAVAHVPYSAAAAVAHAPYTGSAVAAVPSGVMAAGVGPPKRKRGRPRKVIEAPSVPPPLRPLTSAISDPPTKKLRTGNGKRRGAEDEDEGEDGGGPAHNWRDAEVVTLLQSKGRHRDLFRDPKDKRRLSEGWQAILLDVNRIHGTNITAMQLKSKFQRVRNEIRAIQLHNGTRSKPTPSYWEFAVSFFGVGEGHHCFGQSPVEAIGAGWEDDMGERELENRTGAAGRRRPLEGMSVDRDTCSPAPRSEASSSMVTIRSGVMAQSEAFSVLGNSMEVSMGKLGSSLEVMGMQMKEGLSALGTHIAAGMAGARRADEGVELLGSRLDVLIELQRDSLRTLNAMVELQRESSRKLDALLELSILKMAAE
ncbi:hypothetical protein HK101_010029 [Irineochytrium annulatum]|nr:hypothetical protein HK101_010029 [Irineochytrium annulatum]